ncbi:MAG: polysaccharide biosynthesis C-terminal domain-containing protein, partial [Clostridia bacterium]|nr:polysaccharide biosynthesis C-terminal domain-containing protein [Clostridia bacterium]
VINMPIVIAIALAAAIVPTLSYSYAKKDAYGIKERSSACVKIALIIGVPCFFGLFALAPHILRALYPSLSASQAELAVTLMRISAINVILASGVQIYTAILQSLNMAGFCLRAGALLSAIRIAGEVALSYVLGIKGVCLAWSIYNLMFLLVLIYKHAFLLGRNVALIKNVSKILLGGVIMYAPVTIASIFISNAYIAIAVGTVAGALLYLPLVILLGIMSKEELMSLPFGNKIYAAARFINRRNYG